MIMQTAIRFEDQAAAERHDYAGQLAGLEEAIGFDPDRETLAVANGRLIFTCGPMLQSASRPVDLTRRATAIRPVLAAALADMAYEIARLRAARDATRDGVPPAWNVGISLDAAMALLAAGGTFVSLHGMLLDQMRPRCAEMPTDPESRWRGERRRAEAAARTEVLWNQVFDGHDDVELRFATSATDSGDLRIGLRLLRIGDVLTMKQDLTTRSDRRLSLSRTLSEREIAMLGSGRGLADVIPHPMLAALPLAIADVRVYGNRTNHSSMQVFGRTHPISIRLGTTPDAILDEAVRLRDAVFAVDGHERRPRTFTHPRTMDEEALRAWLGTDRPETATTLDPRAGLAAALRKRHRRHMEAGTDPWSDLADLAYAHVEGPFPSGIEDAPTMPIEHLPAKDSVRRFLLTLPWRTVGGIDEATDAELLRHPGLGNATLREIRAAIASVQSGN